MNENVSDDWRVELGLLTIGILFLSGIVYFSPKPNPYHSGTFTSTVTTTVTHTKTVTTEIGSSQTTNSDGSCSVNSFGFLSCGGADP
jgi:hypothetical protein